MVRIEQIKKWADLWKRSKLLKGLLKNQTKLILVVLVTILITGSIEYGLENIEVLAVNNSIEIADDSDYSSSTNLDIFNIGENDLSKLWGIKKYGGTRSRKFLNTTINISTGDNTIPTEVKGICTRSGTFSSNDIYLILNNNTGASTLGIVKTDGDFKANNITMNITAKTREIYRIFNTGTTNDPNNFEARNIKIVANNTNGNFIGITNKLKGLNNIYINLNGAGSMNQKSNFSANNILLALTNSSKDGKTLGIDVASKTLTTKNDLSIEISGEARYVKGNSVINEDTYLNMKGRTQEAYGFSGTTS